MPLNKPSGNMYPWAYTINFIAGECPHVCGYCYVSSKIAPWMKRMGNDKYYGSLRLVESELKVPLIVPDDYIVFVQSCGDLFAAEVSEPWIWRILRRCQEFPKTTFLFQSKNPARFLWHKFPDNCILGTTIETNREYALTKAPQPEKRYWAMRELTKIYQVMVSVEPIMDFDLEVLLKWLRDIKPKFVSIGADSGKNNLNEPSNEKLVELIKELNKFTEVLMKPNLSRLLLPAKKRISQSQPCDLSDCGSDQKELEKRNG